MKKNSPTVIVCLLAADVALAALPIPRLNTVLPAGVKRGETVEVKLTGSDLEEPAGLVFSRPGIEAKIADGKILVTAAKDAEVGYVDAAFVGKWGVSNPRTFLLSDWTETTEVEPNNLISEAKDVPLGVINGLANGRSDVDYFRFPAEKGQRLTIECFAERLDSRLDPVLSLFDENGENLAISRDTVGKDAVIDFVAPAKGRYIVKIHDLVFNGGGEHFYRLAVHSDPVIDYVYPPVVNPGFDGKLTAYGRNLPGAPKPEQFGVAVPLESVPVHVKAPAQPYGLEVETPARPHHAWGDGFDFRWKAGETPCFPVFVGLTDVAVVPESEPNDGQASAQKIEWPSELVGRLDRPGDEDWFRFTAAKGDVVQLEGFAERSGFDVDLYVLVRRIVSSDKQPPAGEVNAQDMGEHDDDRRNVGRTKFDTTAHDPSATVKIPADGDYLLLVRDRYAESRGNARMVYRLRLDRPKPDFRLALVPVDENAPSSGVVFQGSRLMLHALALRTGGFNGPIELKVTEAPKGITAETVVIGDQLNEAPLVLSAGKDAAQAVGTLKVEGTAQIDGKSVVRSAEAGVIVWPGGNNQPKPARLTRGTFIAVRNDAPYGLSADAPTALIGQGSQLSIGLTLDRRWKDFTKPLTNVTALNLPRNVNNQTVTIGDKKTAGALHLYFKNNVPPGRYSFVVQGTAKVPFTKTPEDPKAKKKDVDVALPSNAVTVTVVPRLFDLSANPKTPSVKIGQTTSVKVTIKRVGDYKGPVMLQLVTPTAVAGLTATPVTVPPDKKEAQLEIQADATAAAGDQQFIVIRGSGEKDGKTVTSDVQMTVKVTSDEKKKEHEPKK